MNLYYLFGGCLLLVIVSWMVFRDIFSPISVLCEMFAISSYFAIISAQIHTVDINSKTTIYILLQLIISIVFGAFIHGLSYKKNVSQIDAVIEINMSRYKVLLSVIILATLIYGFFFGRAILSGRGANFSELLFSFRQSSVTTGSGIPSYVQYLSKGIYAFAYFSIYVYMHNRIANKNNNVVDKNQGIYLISVVLLLLTAILSGARAEIIYFICGIAAYYSILTNKTRNKSFSFKRLFKVVLYIIIILIAFYYSSILIGRSGSSFISYVSAYFGSPIIAFNNYYMNPSFSSEVWGKELFHSIIHVFQKLGLVGGEITNVHREYLYLNGQIYTNVYTCFRAYISEVGIALSFVVQIVFVWFYERYYIKIYNKKNVFGYINNSVIVYGLIAYGFFLLFYGNYFFGLILSSHTLIQIMLLYLFKWYTASYNDKMAQKQK